MHTKCKMVRTCLPEAMLINSTTLTMTWMASSQKALGPCVWALVSAVHCPTYAIDQPTSMEAIPFFSSKSGQKFCATVGLPTQKLKLGYTCQPYNLYIPCRF